MKSNVNKLLLGLCLVFLVILLIEWQIIGDSENKFDESQSVEGIQQEDVIDLPEVELAKKTIDNYSDMVERPLFIKGRKPLEGAGEDNSFNEVGKIEDLILLGIYSIEGQMKALFNKQGRNEKFLKKSEGDDVSGWLLKEIQTDRVVLEQSGRKQTVMLRKPKKQNIKKKPKVPTPKSIKLKR